MHRHVTVSITKVILNLMVIFPIIIPIIITIIIPIIITINIPIIITIIIPMMMTARMSGAHTCWEENETTGGVL